ncbi:MAG: hypothetical protein HZA36_01000 [Parcubacteria group bacterium]|nr:hypothetical protein [Parcubacteria group bacterium]
MKFQLYKKIGCTVLIVFVLFTGQAKAIPVEITIDFKEELEKALGVAGAAIVIADVTVIVNNAVTASVGAVSACTDAQTKIALASKDMAEDFFTGILGGLGINTPLKLLTTQKDIDSATNLSLHQKFVLTECLKIATAQSELIGFLSLAGPLVAIADHAGIDPANIITDAMISFHEQINAVKKNVADRMSLIETGRIKAEQKKARQLIQFDQILKKITERMKLALTEKIKSTILDTIQNSGAPRWVTNWAGRYANKFLSSYDQAQKQSSARLEEDYQKARSFTTIGGLQRAIAINPRYIYSLNLLLGGSEAALRAEEDAKRIENEAIATKGILGEGECVSPGGIKKPKSVNTETGTTNRDLQVFQTYNSDVLQRFASNEQLLTPKNLNRVALSKSLSAGAGSGSNGQPSLPFAGGGAINVFSAPICSSYKSQDMCPSTCHWDTKTPAVAYEQMIKEFIGIDIKQMLNNTIEEWVNSFLDNSVIGKLSGKGGLGKTADIGDILKQQLLGQLSKYGDALDDNNPAKDLIQQIVSQGGSLDGVFGNSGNSQGSRNQLSQYGNSLPSGDPMKETINKIVAAGNNPGGDDGTLSGISIGGGTGQSSGKIDCSAFSGSAKADCEIASGLFNSNKELQKQMINETIENMDMPGRISRATENLNTIATKLNQVKTIYADIAKCPTDNQQLARDTLPLIEDMVEDNLATKDMLQNVQDSIDQFKNSSPEKLETLMENESQFLESIDSTMKEIEDTNIPRYFTSIRTWLSQIIKFQTTLTIEVENISTTIPANINVTNGCQQSPFTTDTSGTLFVQTLTQKEYTLSDFFSAWGKTFNQTQLFNLPPVDGFRDLTMSVNNATSTEYQALKLQGNQNIVIKYTTKPPGTCINNKLIDGLFCTDQQAGQLCVSGQLNGTLCIRQTNQNCIPLNNQLWCF